MTEPLPPPGDVALPGGAVMGPDGSISFPGQQDQAAAEGLLPAAPGFPVPRQAAPPPAGSGQFTVDLARAPIALRELRAAKTNLEEILQDCSVLGNVSSPGADSVSRDAATALSAAAIQGPGSLHASLSAGVDRLSLVIDKVLEDLRQYGYAESDADAIFNNRI